MDVLVEEFECLNLLSDCGGDKEYQLSLRMCLTLTKMVTISSSSAERYKCNEGFLTESK